MGIENDEQVLPTDGFADFDEGDTDNDLVDFANEEQELTKEAAIATDENSPVVEEVEDENVDEYDNTETDPDSVTVPTNEDGTPETTEAEETTTEEAKADKPKANKYEEYTKKVQRRINKEVKQREILRADNEALRQRLEALENHAVQSEQEREEERVKSDFEVLNNRLRNANSIKQKLMEEGEYEEVAKVDSDIMQMTIHKAKLEERNAAAQYEADTRKEPEQSEYTDQNADRPINIPDVQKLWIQNNPRFGQDKAYTQYVNDTYDAMLEEGYDPEERSMYLELNRRTGTKNPVPQQRTQQPQQRQQTKPRRQAAPTPNVSQAQSRSKTRSGITEADKVNMRNWGMDPNDPTVRKEWLANKRG